MSKTKIVLASILKPVDDTRMYEKIGISLGQTNKYDINIIGFYPKKIPATLSTIQLRPLFNFQRISFKRVLAPWKCFLEYIKVKPKVIIFNTHELLIVTVLYKIIFGCKICYDIRENHYRNLLYGRGFIKLARPILAIYVRAKEYLTRPWIDLYLLAEKTYEQEFTFSRKKSITVENKYRAVHVPSQAKKPQGEIVLAFSGTLGETTGIFETIELAKRLHAENHLARLVIIGHCAKRHTLVHLQALVKEHPFIQLIGGDSLVPHHQVITVLKGAHFGMIGYPKNKSTENSIPTKLYEYLALRLPIILQRNDSWEEICNRYQACIPIDYDTVEAKELLQIMKSNSFYTTPPGNEILWDSEEKKLLDHLERLSP